MHLCLTLDYELYGNGTGDVLDDVVRPTDALLDVCDRRGIKITIFFEVVEYWKLREAFPEAREGRRSPAALMSEQIRRACADGHDVQVHFHPQWLGAVFEEGSWRLNPRYWRLPEVPSEASDVEMSLEEMFLRGKETLESLLRPVDSSYRCFIHRAGGFNIVPSDRVLSAMRQAGYRLDSSVYAGGFERSAYYAFDYRSVDNTIPYWETHTDDILDRSGRRSAETGIHEVPLFSMPMRRYRKYDLQRLKTKLRSRAAYRSTLAQAGGKTADAKGLVRKARHMLQPEHVLWDFCLSSRSKMRRFYRAAQEIARRSAYDFHPFVLIGHSKEFRNPENFAAFLDYCLEQQDRFLRLADVAERLDRRAAAGPAV